MFLRIETTSIAKAWIQAMQQVIFDGDMIRTQYDSNDDFPSRDATSAIHVTEPISDPLSFNGKPRLINGQEVYCHTGDVYCIESIKSGYLSEVMSGEKDKFVIKNALDQTKSFPYTYHDRLFNYKPVNIEDLMLKHIKDHPFAEGDERKFIESIIPIDQVEEIIKHLNESPYSRRAQAITWRPISDNYREDPPCLQRVWARIFNGNLLRLDVHWRSRDLFGAWSANMNGMIAIGKKIADATNSKLNEIFDFCDSIHVYGKQKKLYKEIVPLLEVVRNVEGLIEPRYNQLLDKLVAEARDFESKKRD